MSVARVLHRPSHCLTLLARRHASSPAAVASSDRNIANTPSPGSTTPLSSCPADTKLEGLNFLKGQAAVLSLSDDKYPEWLWSILQPKEHPDDGPGGKAERVKRRAENKQRIKDRNFMSTQ